MSSIFKTFGRGLLYVVLFPLLVVGIAIYAVLGIFIYLFQLGKLIYLFFTGRTLFSDLEEDIALKAKLAANAPEENKESELSLYPSDSPIYTSGYMSPTYEDKEEHKPEYEEDVKSEEDSDNEY